LDSCASEGHERGVDGVEFIDGTVVGEDLRQFQVDGFG
jgi:hypothetical protein